MAGLRVTRSVTIPDDELTFEFTTSGGPGGQHANKVATRVKLTWDVAGSRALGPRQRETVRRNLKNRIDSSGKLRISSDRYRSQLRNREDALQRLADLVAAALRPRKKRVPTSPTKAAKERRLEEKRRRSAIKRQRRVTSDD